VRTSDARLIDQWLDRDVVRTAIGLNTWQGVEYVDRDAFETVLRWAVRLDVIDGIVPKRADLAARLSAAAATAGYRVDRLQALLGATAVRRQRAPRTSETPGTPKTRPNTGKRPSRR
jgi:hypothetical protein